MNEDLPPSGTFSRRDFLSIGVSAPFIHQNIAEVSSSHSSVFSGRLVGPNDTAARNAEVAVYDKTQDPPAPMGTQQTNPNGQFELSLSSREGGLFVAAQPNLNNPSLFTVHDLGEDGGAGDTYVLDRELLSGPETANALGNAGTVTAWRELQPNTPTRQTLYIELANTKYSGEPWGELSPNTFWGTDWIHRLKKASFSLTVPETVDLAYPIDDNVDEQVLVYESTEDMQNALEKWHPARDPSLPFLELTGGRNSPHFNNLRDPDDTYQERKHARKGIELLVSLIPKVDTAKTLVDLIDWAAETDNIDTRVGEYATTDGQPPSPNEHDTRRVAWIGDKDAVVCGFPLQMPSDTETQLVLPEAKWNYTAQSSSPAGSTLFEHTVQFGVQQEKSAVPALKERSDTTTTVDVMRGEIKLGILLPLTGELGSIGETLRDAALLPVYIVNDAAAPVTVEHQSADTETDPAAGVSAAESLVDAGYPAVVGPAMSTTTLRVSRQVFIPNQVVGCSPSSTSPEVTDLGDSDYIFRTAPSDTLEGSAAARVAVNRLDGTTAATMAPNTTYGQTLSEAFATRFEAEGGTIQSQVAFEPDRDSYVSSLAGALENDPDVLYIAAFLASGLTILKDFYTNYSATDYDIIVTDGIRYDDLREDVGHSLANITGVAPHPEGPQHDAFERQYEETYDRESSVFNEHAYDATAVLLLANAAARENDGTAIRDTMRSVANPGGTEVGPENLGEGIQMAQRGEEIQYIGASSRVNFDEHGDMATSTYEVFEFKDGENGSRTVDTIRIDSRR